MPASPQRPGPPRTPADAEALASAREARRAAWLGAAAAGDVRAFEQFHDDSYGVARGLARRIVPAADVDEVLDDAFFQAWQQCGRFDAARAGATTWLLTLVRSRALDLLRRHAARPASADAEAGAEADQADPAPGPEALLAQAQAGSRLHAALARLGPQQRWLLGLAFFRDLSHAQIAAQTGLPLGTVKSVLSRAQARLRQQLVGSAD
jgi:RNA polymerase sigma-70 factor (ECF subfamily)